MMVFGIEINKTVLYQVVKMQLANKRQGTQSALTRAVRGGEENPGGRRNRTGKTWQYPLPIRIKGGVTLQSQGIIHIHCLKNTQAGYEKRLVFKVANKEIIVLDSINLPEAKTKEMVKVLKNLNVGRKLLLFYLVRMRWYSGLPLYLVLSWPIQIRLTFGYFKLWYIYSYSRCCAPDRGGGLMKNPHDVIIQPVLTEKSYTDMQEGNIHL